MNGPLRIVFLYLTNKINRFRTLNNALSVETLKVVCLYQPLNPFSLITALSIHALLYT